jgi:hypothetical protein
VARIGDVVGDGQEVRPRPGNRVARGVVRPGRVERLGVGEALERASEQAHPPMAVQRAMASSAAASASPVRPWARRSADGASLRPIAITSGRCLAIARIATAQRADWAA